MKNRFKICSAVLAATMALASVSSVMAATTTSVAQATATTSANSRAAVITSGTSVTTANGVAINSDVAGTPITFKADKMALGAANQITLIKGETAIMQVDDATRPLISFAVESGSGSTVSSATNGKANIVANSVGKTTFKISSTNGSTTDEVYFTVNVVDGALKSFGYKTVNGVTGVPFSNMSVLRSEAGQTLKTLDLGIGFGSGTTNSGANNITPQNISATATITSPTATPRYLTAITNAAAGTPEEVAFKRVFTDGTGTNASALTWTSSNESVATVGANGVVTIGTTVGTTVITAKTVTGFTAALNLSTDQVAATGLKVNSDKEVAYVGDTVKFSAEFTPDGASKPTNFDRFEYSLASTPPGVLGTDYTFNKNTGEYKALKQAAIGNIEVTVNALDVAGNPITLTTTNKTISVQEKTVTGFDLTSNNINLNFNDNYVLKSTNTPLSGEKEKSKFIVAFANKAQAQESALTYAKEDGTPLTVSGGVTNIAGKDFYTLVDGGGSNVLDSLDILASNVKTSGTLTVFALDDTGNVLANTMADTQFIKTVPVNVAQQTLATGVAITPATASVEVGSTATLVASVTPSDTTDKTVTWTSSDDTIATVDANGVVKGIAAGTATITATSTNGIKGTSTVTVTKPAEDTLEGWVSQMYQSLWGFLPAQSVLDQNVADIKADKINTAELLKSLLKSDNYTNRALDSTQKIEALYKALFNRDADSTGKQYWSERLEAGATDIGIAKGFTQSPEYKDLCKSYKVADTAMTKDQWVDENNTLTMGIYHLYNATLNRKPDTAGYNFWAERVLTGVESYASVTRSFYESVEYLARGLNNSDFLDTAYQGVLRRNPDTGGKNMFTDQLNRGVSRIEVINQLLASPEFSTANADIPNLR